VGAAAPEIPKAVSEVVLGSEMQNQGCSLTVAVNVCNVLITPMRFKNAKSFKVSVKQK